MDDYSLIDKDLLECVCSFLAPFEEVINELSGDKEPTIYKVLPRRQYLINHCRLHPDDHHGIRQIKAFISNVITQKVEELLFMSQKKNFESYISSHNRVIKKYPSLVEKVKYFLMFIN